MADSNNSFTSKFYGDIMPKIYGLGAAVVIVGAMFKLNGWAGATTMLIIGLGVEALIFAFSAFEPKATDYTKLLYEGSAKPNGKASSDDDVSFKKLLQEGALKKEDLQQLKAGFGTLAANAKEMADMTNATVATNEYAKSAKSAAGSLAKIDQSSGAAAAAFAEVATSVKGSSTNQTQLKTASEQYLGQLNQATEGLKAMTAMYKSEFADTDSVKKYFEAYMKNMESAIEGATKSSKEMEKFQAQLTKLNANVGALNGVYGAMLGAMKQVNNQ
ncbi:gliding motility-associated protein GldL [Roseivirga pacifica]|uniref:Gliding motility-associated protein GldL n=1 Tax=Roseivirga pacifica TaxID=1267423 RepID=A0A1I0N2U8_9BACT|nr:gliding motility protein GldL [Roseivirga pacifica]MCO6359379.1 gliding motility protein GldL [Roseivirga pacifica]MCO6366749.1 gliding motility protein GldL [Roseivirga pacifica]MCO6370719.1 gliding motility protein GldL [Roseivirga pacifica]MCO6374405.1 gliding motility protein GldL [Roseivirga pacifica]MCO6379664.1 gliding motility protein GldL [Roseivirga pacifica]